MENNTKGKSNIFRISVYAFLSALALLSPVIVRAVDITKNVTLLQLAERLRACIPFTGILGGVTVAGLWIFYKYYFDKRDNGGLPKSKAFLSLSVIFAVIMVWGMSIRLYDSLAFIFSDIFQFLFSAVLTVGYAVFFYALFALALGAFERRAERPLEPRVPSNNRPASILLDKHPIIVPFCFLIICWLPYWIVHFPGTMAYDLTWALGGYFGTGGWTDHHPVLSTMIYGTLVRLGRALSEGEHLAAFFCALFQHLLFAGVIVYGMCSMKQWGISQGIRLAALCFFAFCPIVAYWPQAVMKDCAFAAFLLCFAIAVLNLIRKINTNEPFLPEIIIGILSGMLTCLMRHNGLYIIIVSIPALLLIRSSRKTKTIIVAASLVAVFGTMLVSNFLCNLVDAKKGSVVEALSVPLQQTARYVRDHGDEVTDEERSAIDAILHYDQLAGSYMSERSDAVRVLFKEEGRDKLSAYFAAWFKMFFKHPVTYIEALLGDSYTYFTPDGNLPISREYIFNKNDNVGGWSNFTFVNPDNTVRTMFENGIHVIRQLPGIGLLCCLGTYSWILFILIAVAAYKRKLYLAIGCMPSIMNLLCCIASPVNGLLRYFLPNVLIIPFLIGWFIIELSNKKELEELGEPERVCDDDLPTTEDAATV